jgi:hypothetical protein
MKEIISFFAFLPAMIASFFGYKTAETIITPTIEAKQASSTIEISKDTSIQDMFRENNEVAQLKKQNALLQELIQKIPTSTTLITQESQKPEPKDKVSPVVNLVNLTRSETFSGVIEIPTGIYDPSPENNNFLENLVSSGLAKAECHVDNERFWSSTDEREILRRSYGLNLDTSKYSNGAHIIACEAYDRAGNVGKDEVIISFNN